MVREVWKSTFSERDWECEHLLACSRAVECRWQTQRRVAEERWWDLPRSIHREKEEEEDRNQSESKMLIPVQLSRCRVTGTETMKVEVKLKNLNAWWGKQSGSCCKSKSKAAGAHIHTRLSCVYIFRRKEIWECNPLLWPQAGAAHPNPHFNTHPAKEKKLKWPRKNLQETKQTNKQTGRDGQAFGLVLICFSKEPVCWEKVMQIWIEKLFVFIFVLWVTFSLFFCMDTGKRSSISPTFGKCVFV